MLTPLVSNKISDWLESDVIDKDSKIAIEKLRSENKESELNDAFYKDLAFGTGGLRGIMGVGSNRMNKYTVGKATQGLANYLLASFKNEEIKIAIAYDSRHNNKFFANVVSSVMSANNIKVYLFEDLRPTPELSFAIRHLKCQSGIVITASHNPKEYNGYKVYWNDGAQVVSPIDVEIIEEVNKLTDFSSVNFKAKKELIEIIGDEVDQAFLAEINKLCLSPEAIKEHKDLSLVYSPIHGSGVTLVPKALKNFGFENVHVLDSQAKPDGDFPTVPYPNPEEEKAMALGLKKAEELDADILFATDPDADRIGVGMKNNHGKWALLNGNQTAVLLTYYLLERWRDNLKLKGKEYIVYTVVTTDLLGEIASKFGVEKYVTLTGFKYIAEVIREYEGEKQFIGGGEESFGFMVGDFVRDKDAVSSSVMFAEMTAYYKSQGLGVFDKLLSIYQDLGLYHEELVSVTEKGQEGAEKIQKMLANFRENPPRYLNEEKVVLIHDYKSSKTFNLNSASESVLDFPKSNVLQFITEKGTKVSVRPSGTEPKIKFYFSLRTDLVNVQDYDQNLSELKVAVNALKKELKLN